MTTQEAYDKIRAYFTRPGAVLAKRKALNEIEAGEYGVQMGEFICQYRVGGDPEGAACGVGCLIPNEMYDPRIEMVPVLGMLRQEDGLREMFDVTFEDIESWVRVGSETTLAGFLAAVQYRHDDTGTETVEQFVEKLDRLARERGLAVPS